MLDLVSCITRFLKICAVHKAAKSRAVSLSWNRFHHWLVNHESFIGGMDEVLTFHSLLNLLQSDTHSQHSPSLLKVTKHCPLTDFSLLPYLYTTLISWLRSHWYWSFKDFSQYFIQQCLLLSLRGVVNASCPLPCQKSRSSQKIVLRLQFQTC